MPIYLVIELKKKVKLIIKPAINLAEGISTLLFNKIPLFNNTFNDKLQ